VASSVPQPMTSQWLVMGLSQPDPLQFHSPKLPTVAAVSTPLTVLTFVLSRPWYDTRSLMRCASAAFEEAIGS
jgi:hypothetical protein